LTKVNCTLLSISTLLGYREAAALVYAAECITMPEYWVAVKYTYRIVRTAEQLPDTPDDTLTFGGEPVGGRPLIQESVGWAFAVKGAWTTFPGGGRQFNQTGFEFLVLEARIDGWIKYGVNSTIPDYPNTFAEVTLYDDLSESAYTWRIPTQQSFNLFRSADIPDSPPPDGATKPPDERDCLDLGNRFGDLQSLKNEMVEEVRLLRREDLGALQERLAGLKAEQIAKGGETVARIIKLAADTTEALVPVGKVTGTLKDMVELGLSVNKGGPIAVAAAEISEIIRTFGKENDGLPSTLKDLVKLQTKLTKLMLDIGSVAAKAASIDAAADAVSNKAGKLVDLINLGFDAEDTYKASKEWKSISKDIKTIEKGMAKVVDFQQNSESYLERIEVLSTQIEQIYQTYQENCRQSTAPSLLLSELLDVEPIPSLARLQAEGERTADCSCETKAGEAGVVTAQIAEMSLNSLVPSIEMEPTAPA
jgi:hypothetical protein